MGMLFIKDGLVDPLVSVDSSLLKAGGHVWHRDLTGANLSRANISGADLTGATIIGTRTDNVRVDEGTMTNGIILAPGDSNKEIEKALSSLDPKLRDKVLRDNPKLKEVYRE